SSVITAEVLRHNEITDSPSKPTCLTLPGMAPVLVPLQPSNEALLGRAFREQGTSAGTIPSPPPYSTPNVRSKKVFVSVMCCWMSECKSRAPALQSSFV